VTPALLHALRQARQERRLAIVATRLSDGAQSLLMEAEGLLDLAEPVLKPPASLPLAALLPAAQEAAATDRSRLVDLQEEAWFLHVHAPPPRLLIVGAVHIAQVLAPLARASGLSVAVIDPRESFATSDRFPSTDLHGSWPDEALNTLAIDRHTAIVTLTHDAKLDDPALQVALRSPAFYVGALGSRKTQEKRRARLQEAGVAPAEVARLRGPVGLAIGAIGAAEIALSILAEIVAVRRGAPLAAQRGW